MVLLRECHQPESVNRHAYDAPGETCAHCEVVHKKYAGSGALGLDREEV